MTNGVREHCRAPSGCAAKGAGHCRSCHLRRVLARPETWERRRQAFRARCGEPRRADAARRRPGPGPAPLPPRLARWVRAFLCAGWTPHEVARLFGVGVRRVRAEVRA